MTQLPPDPLFGLWQKTLDQLLHDPQQAMAWWEQWNRIAASHMPGYGGARDDGTPTAKPASPAPAAAGADVHGRIAAIEQRLAMLEQRIAILESRVGT